jgi:hypothetical protein
MASYSDRNNRCLSAVTSHLPGWNRHFLAACFVKCTRLQEEYFVGKITDSTDQGDYKMAREYLARQFDAVQIGATLACYRDAADSLVRTHWAQSRIPVIARALLTG